MDRRLSSYQPDGADVREELNAIAADQLELLHRTIREDASSFGLYEAVRTAGERLATDADIRAPAADASELATRITVSVGGAGGTIADTAVRRAAAKSARRLQGQLPEPAPNTASDTTSSAGSGLSGELFCWLYRWFFADVVGEFLRTAIAEKIKLAVPVLYVLDPEDHIADRISTKIFEELPDPCAESGRLADAAGEVEDGEGGAAAITEEPAATLAEIAQRLVPRAAGKALGLITEDGEDGDGGDDEEGADSAQPGPGPYPAPPAPYEGGSD